MLLAGAELEFESFRETGIVNDSDFSDSEDSNAENNWRNDYPDEDEFVDEVDDEVMRKAIDDLSFGDDLSDDAGEEGFIYSIDSETAGFEEDIDRSGEMYARFKMRQKKEEEKYNKDLYHDELDDFDEDYYE